MKYALSNEDRIEATPKAKGICQCCGSELVEKLAHKRYGIGRIKVQEIVTIGGKMKLNGIEIGKIIFQKNGKKLFTYLMTAKNILQMSKHQMV